MKGGTRIAIGVGIGYVLGRTRKMRFALSLAGAAMARRSSGMPGELLERGTSLLKSSPELAQLTDSVRGELAGAVRSAAVTAASNRIDALNARLQQGSTLVEEEGRGRSREADTAEEENHEDYEQAPAREDADVEEERGAGTDRDEDDRRQPARRTPTGRPTTSRARKAAVSRSSDRRSAPAERKPVSATRRRSRADADVEAPVRRTRR
ncbi:hypothetical protein [Nocardia miyunensis]|uniref:hypothetical protein n=1 Tax=Nocardia miyunensis TaxID=282684 RepID=UPI0008334F5D|nr:hypothetical protein [Nocardia miyunensis]